RAATGGVVGLEELHRRGPAHLHAGRDGRRPAHPLVRLLPVTRGPRHRRQVKHAPASIGCVYHTAAQYQSTVTIVTARSDLESRCVKDPSHPEEPSAWLFSTPRSSPSRPRPS